MFLKITQHEWQLHKRGKFQAALLLIMVVLLLLAIITHWQQQQALTLSQQAWQKTSDELWRNQPNRHPHRVAHYGHVAVRPMSPLSFIDAGINPYIGNYLFLEAHKQNSSAIRNTALSPTLMKLGYPSVATLVITLWPLILIVIAFNSFSGERDSGRLKWLMSMGVPAWWLFVGKFLLYFAYTVVLLLVVGIVAGALLTSSGVNAFSVFVTLVGLLMLYALYGAVWIVAILGLSFKARTSAHSLMTLLCLWLVAVIVVPKISTDLAENLYPTPDRANFEVALEKAVHAVGDSHNADDPYFLEFKKQTLATYNVDTIEELPVNWKGLLMAEGERITSTIFQQHYSEVTNQFNRQKTLNAWLGLISPALLVQHLSQAITANDRHANEHFDASAEAFRYELIQRLNNLQAHDIDYEHNDTQKIDRSVWQEMALFDYNIPNLAERITHYRLFIIFYLFWLLLAVMTGTLFKTREFHL